MFKKNASFASAMALFTKAREELKAAHEQNEAVLKDARETVALCEEESANISRATGFLDSILTGEKAASVDNPAA